MRRIETALPDVFLIEPEAIGDARGFFMETYHERKFREMGIAVKFVQDNHSKSAKGILRGLHYQLKRPQAKLCRVVSGEVLDVAVDVRRGSAHFGEWVSALLSADNRRQIFVPAGFAHGFVVLSASAEFLYKCSDFYEPRDERGVLWSDPKLRIDWRTEKPVLSKKDEHLPCLESIPEDQLPRFEAC